jgi:signal transduction histidine kinase
MAGVAIVALVTGIDVEAADRYRFRNDTWWSWAVTIAVCATLLGRRRWPLPTLAIGTALVLPLSIAHHRDSVAFFTIVIALYSVAAYLPLRRAWRGIALMVAFNVTLIAVGVTTLSAAPRTGSLLLATAFSLGRIIRRARNHQERAAEAAIERAAEAIETADLAAANERVRLAQELHDVVAHSLSVIAVQAGIGAHLVDREPVEAARALDAIRVTCGSAAAELVRLVDVLRQGGTADLSSAPTLGDVGTLTEQIRAAGIPTSLMTNGDLASVPVGVSLAAYRIVQEALTNVVRHAGRAEVTVTISVGEDHIDLNIDDNGRGNPASGGDTATDTNADGGHGLVGMAERAEMYGGRTRSGPRPGGGFRVESTLHYFAEPLASERAEAPSIAVRTAHNVAVESRRPPAWLWDVLLALLMTSLATLEIVTFQATSTTPHYTPTHTVGWLLRIGCCLTLALRRRYPTTMLAAGWILGLALTIGNYQVGITVFVFWIGLYTVASYASTPRLIGAVAGTYVGLAVVIVSRPPDLSAAGVAWLGFFLAASAIAGFVVHRDRERRNADLTERGNVADGEARRARLAIVNQRLRIADELSTIITRSINTIAAEAGAGTRLVELDPIATRRTLETISAISRDSLNDLRRLLKRMRTESETAMYSPIVDVTAEHVAVGDCR